MARTYEATHPWLTFSLDLREFPFSLWLLLGEARSKSEHLAGVPLRPATADKLHRIYLAKGVLATTAIEGNTLSIEEVERILDGELKLPPSKEYLQTEIDNIVSACNMIIEHCVRGDGLALSPEIIASFNRLVLDRLELEPEVVAGEIRRHDVGVARYRGAPWKDCGYLLERLTSWLAEMDGALPNELGSAKAIVCAILAHLYLAWIHPFGDGNGRTARLIEFAILVKAGVPVPAAHLLSDFYNETRPRYYRELDRASKSGGDVIPFLLYATQGFVDGLRDQIETVRKQQLDVAWTNYVFEVLSGHSPSTERRRKLVFALTRAGRAVKTRDLMTISPEIALLYARKTPKTLTRDLGELEEHKLVIYEHRGSVRANLELMSAFLPARARTPDR